MHPKLLFSVSVRLWGDTAFDRIPSLSLEPRRALLEERRRPFLFVFGSAAHREQCRFRYNASGSVSSRLCSRLHRILNGQGALAMIFWGWPPRGIRSAGAVTSFTSPMRCASSAEIISPVQHQLHRDPFARPAAATVASP